MKRRIALVLTVALGACLPFTWAGNSGPVTTGPVISWKKTVVDKTFRSEGVAVADVNKDGKLDIISGDVWYEAPDWKMHSMRKERDAKRAPGHKWDPKDYSESFAVFADDFNGDGYVDAIVIPFPGKACFWYENPQGKTGLWKEHLLTNSACNETPIFVDLFGTGKRVLVMGWQPDKQNNMGEMCYFVPGQDATKPWERHSISGPSQKGKEIPGTQRSSHGLGHGDVNGDGRMDIICTGGWWEQPAKAAGKPWKFQPFNLGPGPECADMHVLDIDGDGKGDLISTSAHKTGFWWHQQQPGKSSPTFVRRDLFPLPTALAKEPADYSFTKEEKELYAALNKGRQKQVRVPWRPSSNLSKMARTYAQQVAQGNKDAPKGDYPGKLVLALYFGSKNSPQELAEYLLNKHTDITSPGLEVGVGFVGTEKEGYYTVLIGDRGQFALFGQSHALHLVDINGDGLKDLVTGRRWWAHGPRGDDPGHPGDPAYLYWFEARKGKDGFTNFIPHMIDDDSGIGTQFTVIDMNGDGLPDIVISNKRGVYVFLQVRSKPE